MYQKEKVQKESFEKRLGEAEQTIENLRKAKEHVSTAVLDALHKVCK